jgi:hypothetical protein
MNGPRSFLPEFLRFVVLLSETLWYHGTAYRTGYKMALKYVYSSPVTMRLLILLASLASFLFSLCLAAPKVSLVSNTQLDGSGVFFISYDGVVNVNSFQLSGVLTYSGWQFAAWYTSSKAAVIARRQLPSGAWSTLQLPHTLSTSDSHNVIALGVSPADGKIHVAMDCHSSAVYYTSSEAGLATNGASWAASRFATITTTLAGLNIGT